MKIQEHIGKISWSLADKALFFIYGVVSLFQMRALQTNDWGLFGLMISLHTWIFVVIDSFALQSLIQFGMKEEDKKKVNTIALFLQLILSVIISLLIYSFRFQFAEIFKEDNLIYVATILPILIFLTIPRTFAIKIIYRTQEFHKLFFVNLIFFGVMSFQTFYYIFTQGMLSFENMVWIYFIGSGLSSIFSLFLIKEELKFDLKGNINIKQIIKFALPWTLYSAMNYLPKTLDLYIVQYFFKTEVTGIYYSAKNLFRVFDEALNASFGLIYPTAVKQIVNNNQKGLNDLITKSVSFLFVAFGIAVILLELGLSHFIITTLLPESYHGAISQFNLLLVAALAMPILVLSSVITAAGKPQVVLKFSIVGVILASCTLYIIGKNGIIELIPLGLIVYIYTNAILFYLYMHKNYNLRFINLFRAFNDSFAFVKTLFKKGRN